MRLSKLSDVLGNWIVNVIPACWKAGEAESKVFYYAYAHSHTRCSRTGSDRQLLPSAKQRRPREFKSSVFPNSEFLPTNGVLASLVMQFLAPISSKNHKNLPPPPCQHATGHPDSHSLTSAINVFM